MSAFYRKYKEARADGRTSHASHVEFTVDTIKVALVSSGYIVNLDTHQFLSDLGANVVATSPALTGKSCLLGVYRAANPTFPAVTGATITQTVVYKDTGTASTSPLMIWQNAGTGYPDTPNGSDIIYQIDTGTHGLAE